MAGPQRDPGPYRFQRRGRNAATALLAAAWLAVPAGLIATVGLSPWWLALLLPPVLPAILDLVRDPRSGLVLDDTCLRWHRDGNQVAFDLADLDHLRFDTRWDFSVRVTLMPRAGAGRPLRLPPDVIPPHRAFEAALTARGVAVRRQHFRVF